MTETSLNQLRKEWYSNPIIQFQLVNLLKNRELALLNIKNTEPMRRTRYIKAFHSHFLNLNLNRFDVLKHPNINLYLSLAQLSYIPTASFNLKERTKEDEYIRFGNNYDKYIVAYDVLFDIDAESMEQAYPETMEIKKILDEQKIGYCLYPSGNKGFHIRIPYELLGFSNPRFDDEFRQSIIDFLFYFKEIYGFQYIDNSIVDYKRIAKLPYSLVWDKVVLPLTDEQFNNFSVEMIKIQNINIDEMRNRGLLIRKHGLTDEQLGKNFQKMFKEFQEK